MKRSSIKFNIPFFIMMFAIICVFVTGFLIQYMVGDRLEKSAMEKNMIISKMVSEQINLYLNDAKSTVVTAGNFSSQSKGDLNHIKQEIFRIYDNFDYFSLIFFMGPDAKMVFSKPSNKHVKTRVYTDRTYYWEIMNGEPSAISPLLLSSVLNIRHFVIAAPVYDGYNKRIGLIGAGLPLKNIEAVIDKTQKDFKGKVWLTDENGIMAVHPDYKDDNSLVPMENIEVEMNGVKTDFNSILKEGKNVSCTYTVDGKLRYGAVSFVQDTKWMVVVEQDESTIFYEVLDLNYRLKGVIVFISLVALLFGLIIALRITNPIESLVKQVRGFSDNVNSGEKGIKPIEVNLKHKDEIWELSEAFEDMSLRLQSSIGALERSYHRENELQQYLNNILRSVKSGIVVMDNDRKITVYNKEAERLTGYRSEDIIRDYIEKLWTSIDVDIQHMNHIVDSVLLNGQTLSDHEEVIRTKSGDEIHVSLFASQVIDEEKNVIGIVFLFRDITQVKFIEDELKKEDRIRTIGELSASIIHDIGNPLAGIGNLIEVLRNDICEEDQRDEVLEMVQTEVSDLNRLVVDFLDFSNNSNHELEQIEITGLVDNIINILKPEIIDKKITVIRDYTADNIVVSIRRRDIKQAFINIIKNAIAAVDVDGVINIGIEDNEGSVMITIRDNGIGIEEDRLEKIFYPFHTTKSNGTGLGLYIAYKQIKENGGTIKVHSEINKGTEFIVTLSNLQRKK